MHSEVKKLNELSQIEQAKLFAKLRTSFTHHSSAIEGISLSFGETQKLLEEGLTAPNKSLHEQLVVIGFAEAFDYTLRKAFEKNIKVTTDLIKDMHAILFAKSLEVSPERTDRPIGAWRKDERHIKGLDASLTHPLKIDQEIENLVYASQGALNLKNIAEFHIKFERIHPFADGNGRVGRLLIAFQAIQNNYIPPLILNDNRKEYLNGFKDIDQMEKFLEKSIQASMEIVIDSKRIDNGFELSM